VRFGSDSHATVQDSLTLETGLPGWCAVTNRWGITMSGAGRYCADPVGWDQLALYIYVYVCVYTDSGYRRTRRMVRYLTMLLPCQRLDRVSRIDANRGLWLWLHISTNA
jgi:hypothetical protein